MDTKEKYILTTLHLPTFKWTSSFLFETIARKERNDIQNVLLLETSGKYKVVNRTPAVGYD